MKKGELYMVKKHYEQPLTATERIVPAKLICASEDITSDVGIDYGGVDEDGTKPVDSRRQYDVWDDYEDEEETEEDW